MENIPSTYFFPVVILFTTLIVLLPKLISNKRVANRLSIVCIIILFIICILGFFGYFN